jgi:hypothetical protein
MDTKTTSTTEYLAEQTKRGVRVDSTNNADLNDLVMYVKGQFIPFEKPSEQSDNIAQMLNLLENALSLYPDIKGFGIKFVCEEILLLSYMLGDENRLQANLQTVMAFYKTHQTSISRLFPTMYRLVYNVQQNHQVSNELWDILLYGNKTTYLQGYGKHAYEEIDEMVKMLLDLEYETTHVNYLENAYTNEDTEILWRPDLHATLHYPTEGCLHTKTKVPQYRWAARHVKYDTHREYLEKLLGLAENLVRQRHGLCKREYRNAIPVLNNVVTLQPNMTLDEFHDMLLEQYQNSNSDVPLFDYLSAIDLQYEATAQQENKANVFSMPVNIDYRARFSNHLLEEIECSWKMHDVTFMHLRTVARYWAKHTKEKPLSFFSNPEKFIEDYPMEKILEVLPADGQIIQTTNKFAERNVIPAIQRYYDYFE